MQQAFKVDRAILLIAFCLVSCEPNELRPVPAFPNGSGYSTPSRPTKPQPTTKPLVPDRHPMLDDPEAKTETFTERFFANSQTQAEDACQSKAQRYTSEGKSRVSVVRVRRIKGNLFECVFEAEVEG